MLEGCNTDMKKKIRRGYDNFITFQGWTNCAPDAN